MHLLVVLLDQLPEGPCVDRDIAVTPTARRTVGGSPVKSNDSLRISVVRLASASSVGIAAKVPSESVDAMRALL